MRINRKYLRDFNPTTGYRINHIDTSLYEECNCTFSKAKCRRRRCGCSTDSSSRHAFLKRQTVQLMEECFEEFSFRCYRLSADDERVISK